MKEGCRTERQEEKTPPPENSEKKKEESRAGMKTGPGKQTYNKRMAVPGSKQPSTQMPVWTSGRPNYRTIKLPKPRLTVQLLGIGIGGHFAMRKRCAK